MKKIISVIISLILILSLFTGCHPEKKIDGPSDSNVKQIKETDTAKPIEMTKVTLILDWLPNTNHTGIYSALEKGYYREKGIKLEIIQPQEGDVNALVGAGKGEFGISFQEQITMARTTDNPIPIVAVAAIIQHNTSGFASMKDKNILSPKDFEGKKYGSWGTDIERAFIKTMMDKENSDFSKLEILDIISFDFLTSISNDVDLQWIFYGWDGIAAKVKEKEINFIKLQDIDPRLDFYTPVIISNEDIIANNPELVRDFISATSKGYNYAIENPEDAVKDLLKNAPETDSEIALASQKYLSKQYKADAEKWGIMKESTWVNFGKWMSDNNLLKNTFQPKKAFTNEFLPEQ